MKTDERMAINVYVELYSHDQEGFRVYKINNHSQKYKYMVSDEALSSDGDYYESELTLSEWCKDWETQLFHSIRAAIQYMEKLAKKRFIDDHSVEN